MSTPLPQNLRRLRRQARLSLQQIAQHLGVHFTTVSAWERGRSEPPLKTLGELAQFYGLPVGDLLEGHGPVEPVDPFRALATADGENIIKQLEEVRLLAALAHELERTGALADLGHRSGIHLPRLQALGRGEAQLRPQETARLIRELGAAGTAVFQAAEPKKTAAGRRLPAALEAQAETLLRRLRCYMVGESGAASQK